MKTTRARIVLVAVSAVISTMAQAQSIQFIVVDRQVNYVQSTAGTASLAGANPYEFVIDLNGTSLGSLTFTFKKPGDAITNYTSFERDPGKEWQAPGPQGAYQFANMASLQSAFPDGAYTIQTNLGTTSLLSIPNLIGGTNDGFANMPFLTGTQNGNPVSWSLGKMLVDPTQELTLTSTTFTTNYVTATGRIGLWLDYGVSGQQVTNETVPNNFIFNAATVQMQIAANTLTPGIYGGGLEFNNVTSGGLVNLNANIPGANGVGVYTAYTSFQIQAIPEPSTYAAILGVVALGGVMIRRRRIATVK